MTNKKKACFTRILVFTSMMVSIAAHHSYAQVYGCKDPHANNYDPSATINDGSCRYNLTSYSPPVKVDPMNATLEESSGLQMAGNYLWSFNDGGGEAAIYRIDTISNALLQKVSLTGASNVDWEDIAFDGVYFYVGDFGNNANGARTDLRIYKFPLSAIPDHLNNPVASIPSQQISVINFTYDDQPQPPQASSNNNTKYDCEAMIVEGGAIHLFTKNWIDLNTTHYRIDGTSAGNYVAVPLETLETDYLVTAADKAVGRRTIVLLGYKNTGAASHFMHLLTAYHSGNFFNGNVRRIDLPDVLVMGQAEGICFRTQGYGYISNEQFIRYIGTTPIITIPQRLRSFDLSNFIPAPGPLYIFTGNGNWDLPTNWSNNLMPPAQPSADSEIIIDPAPGGRCLLNVPYSIPPGVKLTVNTTKAFLVQGNLIVNP